jgi:hypothetical protein
LALPPLVNAPGDLDAPASCARENLLHPPGPRLHVLQCVWRC